MAHTRVTLLAGLSLVLTLAACGQAPTPSPSSSFENVPWSTGDESDTITALALSQGSNFLSDQNPVAATNGYGPYEKDTSNGEAAAGDGSFISLDGRGYYKGLGVHANSKLVYNLRRPAGINCTTFTSDIGIDDEVNDQGSVVFKVLVDGVVKYNSGKMTGASATKSVSVDISGAKRLALVVTDAGDNINFDHADWASALITCNGSVPTPQAGNLDATFDKDGLVQVPISTINDARAFNQLDQQPSGKLLAAAQSGVYRFNTDGSRDTSFGGPDATSPTGRLTPLVFAQQPNGGIVIAEQYPYLEQEIVRVTANGQRDTSFGTGGNINVYDDGANSIALAGQADSKFIVAEALRTPQLQSDVSTDIRLKRFNSNGTLDTGFGNGGAVTTTVSPPNTGIGVLSVFVTPDQNILVVSTSRPVNVYNNSLLMARYTSDGQLDPTFGTGGLVYTQPQGTSFFVTNAALQPDGKILVGGVRDSDGTATLARYTSSGVLDATFGTAGVQAFAAFYETNGLAVAADGKILVGLSRSTATDTKSQLYRLNSDGTTDTAFGTAGAANINVAGSVVYAVFVQSDGRIVASVYEPNESADLARLIP